MRWFFGVLGRVWNGLLMILGILAIYFGAKWLLTPDPRTAEEKTIDQYCEPVSAFFASHSFVKDRLKAPATAKFASNRDSQSGAKKVTQCTFLVYGLVDSENSFGANVRSRYSMKLELNPKTEIWTASEIVIR